MMYAVSYWQAASTSTVEQAACDSPQLVYAMGTSAKRE